MYSIENIKTLFDADDFDEWFKVASHAAENIEDFFNNFKDRQKNITLFIDPSATIHPTAILEDKVIVADNVHIGPYSYIGNHSIILSGTKIGYNVEIIKSLIMNNVKILHSACIGNSIIGNYCNIGAGFITATRRLDNRSILVQGPSDAYFYSKRSHYGVLIGPNVHLGIQVITMPGSVIGKNSLIYPRSIISGCIEPNFIGCVDVSWRIKKIVFWTEDFFPTIGGTEISIYRQIKLLSEKGYEAIVITPDSGPSNGPYTKIVTRKIDYIADGLNIIKENYVSSEMIYITRIFKGNALSHLKAIKDISDVGKVVIRIPTLGNMDRISHYPLNSYLKNVSGFICLSNAIREEISRYLTDPKLFTQRNGVSLNEFPTSRFSEDGDFLVASRIADNKGIDVLLRAWERYKRYGGKRNLIIIATHRHHYRIQQLENQDWLNEHDIILKDTLNDLWRDIDVEGICAVIIPSLKEGHSNLMLESMASYVPLIASKIPGLEEDILTSGGGILFDKGEDQGLSEILIGVDKNKYDLKLIGERGRRFISSSRTIEHTVNNLLSIINSISQ